MLRRLVPTVAMLLIVAAVIAAESCSILDPAPPRPNEGLIDFRLSAGTAEADDAHLDTVVAVIDPAYRSLNAAVAFTTTAGTFTNGTASITVTPDSVGVARAFLKAAKDSTVAIVSASAGGRFETRRLTYLPAYPSWINVTAVPIVVKAALGATTDVSAALVRRIGTTSSGGVVVFQPGQVITGAPSVRVSPDSVATNTTATSKLVLLGADTGSFYVRAFYSRDHRLSARDSVLIRVVPQ